MLPFRSLRPECPQRSPPMASRGSEYRDCRCRDNEEVPSARAQWTNRRERGRRAALDSGRSTRFRQKQQTTTMAANARYPIVIVLDLAVQLEFRASTPSALMPTQMMSPVSDAILFMLSPPRRALRLTYSDAGKTGPWKGAPGLGHVQKGQLLQDTDKSNSAKTSV